MPLLRVRADFNTSSLDNYLTREDLKRQGIELCDGMRCVFYDLDADDDGRPGFLHCWAEVWWDAASKVFRMRGGSEFQFTAGDDVAVLDSFYRETAS